MTHGSATIVLEKTVIFLELRFCDMFSFTFFGKVPF